MGGELENDTDEHSLNSVAQTTPTFPPRKQIIDDT